MKHPLLFLVVLKGSRVGQTVALICNQYWVQNDFSFYGAAPSFKIAQSGATHVERDANRK
jgi:hypothetical protein